MFEGLPGKEVEPLTRQVVIEALSNVVENARREIDDLTTNGKEVLSDEEQVDLGIVAEQLHTLGGKLTNWQ